MIALGNVHSQAACTSQRGYAVDALHRASLLGLLGIPIITAKGDFCLCGVHLRQPWSNAQALQNPSACFGEASVPCYTRTRLDRTRSLTGRRER